MHAADTAARRHAPAQPAPGRHPEGVAAISKALSALLADMFALYVKTTKTSHWHMSDAQFRDYHLLLDEQSSEILATTDLIAERLRKLGGTTLRAIGQIARLQRAPDNDNDTVDTRHMLTELLADNRRLAEYLHRAHSLCVDYRDIASASLIEDRIDEAKQRVRLLAETPAMRARAIVMEIRRRRGRQP
jgi:starvation-inducible DNA-binding protein